MNHKIIIGIILLTSLNSFGATEGEDGPTQKRRPSATHHGALSTTFEALQSLYPTGTISRISGQHGAADQYLVTTDTFPNSREELYLNVDTLRPERKLTLQKNPDTHGWGVLSDEHLF